MPSAKELRDELRALRKEKSVPISKMKKGDVAAEIERLKVAREETPAPAVTPSAPPKRVKAAAESIKAAKAQEFPVAPSDSGTKKGMPRKTARKAYEDVPKKKESKMEKLMKMLEEMSDSE